MIKQARKEVKAPGFRDMKSVRMQAVENLLLHLAPLTQSHVAKQVTEATLLPYLGGELGAKGAAVEEVVKNLPAV